MYEKCMEQICKLSFILMPPSDVNLMYANVVELDKFYFLSDNYFKVHSVSF